MQHFIGIDIGSTTCHAAICTGLSGQVEQQPLAFDNTDEGISTFTNYLASQGCCKETSVICMESCGVYAETLCYLLTIAGWQVAVEAPQKVARAMPPNSAKTDSIDAWRIARFAARYCDELHIWRLPSETLELSSTLLTLREGYTKQSTQLQNQLQSIKRKHVRSTFAEKMLEDDIIRLKNHIKELDKEIKRLIDSDGTLKAIFTSIKSVPGVGQTLATYMLIATDCFRNGFNDKKLSAYLGIAPLDYQSGTSVYRKSRSRGFGHQTIRKLLYLGAMSALRNNKCLKAYFQRLVGIGKNKHLIINNIENKIISFICAVVRNGTVFSKNYRAAI